MPAISRSDLRRPVRRRVRALCGALLALALAAPAAAQVHTLRATTATRVVRPVAGPDGAVMGTLRRIETTLRASRYSHSTSVDERAGRYEFDCSGMTAWVLARTAPEAHRAVMAHTTNGRALARDYYRQIAASPAGRAANGWTRVARVADAQPGDVIAWIRPRIVQSSNTGHVAFVVAAPEALAGVPGAYLVRIADASSYQHQDDSREGTGRTGFGYGTILVMADLASGAPVAYGWFGRYSPWVLATQMGIGRPTR